MPCRCVYDGPRKFCVVLSRLHSPCVRGAGKKKRDRGGEGGQLALPSPGAGPAASDDDEAKGPEVQGEAEHQMAPPMPGVAEDGDSAGPRARDLPLPSPGLRSSESMRTPWETRCERHFPA